MTRRRAIEPGAANSLIREAERSGAPVEGVVFPVMTYRAATLRGVRFVDCEVGRLTFGGPLFGRIELVDCSFVGCDGPSHVRYHNVTFTGCRWERGELFGSIRKVVMRDCLMAGTKLVELHIENSLLERVNVVDTKSSDLLIRDTAFRQLTMAGSVHGFSLVDDEAEELDLSRLRVVDGGLLRLSGSQIRFPDFPDSFVISDSNLKSLENRLMGLVRPEAHATLRRLLGDGFELEMIDSSRLSITFRDDEPILWPNEQDAVLRTLWELRILKWP